MLIGIFDLMGAQTDRLRCEVCQNLILSLMNAGLLRYAVATTPPVYGIETIFTRYSTFSFFLLQQHLPFTVLKLFHVACNSHSLSRVATTPTVYGIETL